MMRILHFTLLIIMIWRRCLTCRTVLGLRSKPRLRQKSEPTTDAKSVEPSQVDVDNLLVTVSFSLDEETIQHICSNPSPETAFSVMVKRRRAEVKLSTLSAEQRRELVEANDREFNTFVKYSVASGDHTVCSDEHALGCDVQG